MKTLGLIGGMSWESTAIYYRLLNRGIRERLGGQHSAPIILWSFDFAEIEELQASGEWEAAAERLVDVALRLQTAGADALFICTNTMHKLAEEITRAVTVPLIHIADATANSIKQTGSRKPVLLGTAYTMEQDFYKGRLREDHGIDVVVPDAADRVRIHRIIYDELCQGIIRPESKKFYLKTIQALEESGADGGIFLCTEGGLLLSRTDLDVPVVDSTQSHVTAALEFCLS